MDKTTIAQRAAQMKTRDDLLLLLNDIRHDELTEAGREEDYPSVRAVAVAFPRPAPGHINICFMR